MTEAEFLDRIIGCAKWTGWLVCHFRPARTDKGWRTPLQGMPGFVDLILAQNGTVLMAEVKTEDGRQSKYQELWQEQMGEHYLLWRPHDWPAIEALLKRRGK